MFPIKNFSDIKSPINLSKKTRWTLAPVDWGRRPVKVDSVLQVYSDRVLAVTAATTPSIPGAQRYC